MFRKLFSALMAIVVLAGTPSILAGANSANAAGPSTIEFAQKGVDKLFTASKFDAHYRMPNEGKVPLLLEEQGFSLSGLSAEQQNAAVQEYQSKFAELNPTTVDPRKLDELLKNEQEGKIKTASTTETDRSIKSLVTLAEFDPGEETWTSHVNAAGVCVDTQVTFAGPLHNEIAAPGPRDNNTIWYDDTTPALYEEIYFGEGPDAGVTVEHPNLGAVDLHGKTMVNYYLEMSHGKFAPAGEVYPVWFQADHSEAWYGEDGCGGSHNVRAGDLVLEILDKLNDADPDFAWQSFDGDSDGVVDNFTVIHAGAGQEAGGGVQGNFAIWSHASMVGWPDGVLVCAKGAAGCPDRDIRVLSYSMDPENIDLGVIAEEFGHAAFGLPDLYTTDAQGSLSNWAIMEAGSWNGILGGTEPAPFPEWFKYILGWDTPKVINFDSEPTVTEIGQLEMTPADKQTALKINLPDKEVSVPNPLDTGKAFWSDVADGINNTLTRSLDLTGTTAPVLSFLSDWSIEEDWDYGYVQVSTDNGQTWTFLPDMDGVFTTTDPNGNNQGVGLTGENHGTLRINLAAYAGQQILLRLLYSTDTAVQLNGWFVDNFNLNDGSTTKWSDDLEGDTSSWTFDGWRTVPLTEQYPRYYLVEWRNNQGFDHGLQYPYATVYNDEDEWQVDRAPYTVPGMLVYLRDTSYAFDYTLLDGSEWESPSAGPKHGLLLVDSHFWPYEWSSVKYSSGANYRVNSRVQPGNASFTLQETTPFTLKLGFNPSNGQYLDTPIETKTFGPLPAVPAFHDSLGYYPGLWYKPANDGLYYWDRQASMAIPAKDDYSIRITDVNKAPFTDLYGANVGFPLGTGNPGDDGVQFGLHIALTGKAVDGTWGKIQTWNSMSLTALSIQASKPAVRADDILSYTFTVENVTPVDQNFTVKGKIPENTVYLSGLSYDRTSNTVQWSSTVPANGKKSATFFVRVGGGVPSGEFIVTSAVLTDEALGSSAENSTPVGFVQFLPLLKR